MIGKLKIIAFVFLCLFLISTVSADELNNETEEFIIETNDIEMYYHDGSRFNAVVHDSENNPVSNENISFNLNDIDYSRTTNDKGQASLGINLNSGNYIITTTFNDISKNNTILIKSTIEGKDITKMYKNSTQYTAKFVDSNGEALKNTKVNFNINGVIYSRTCNEMGIAKLNINLPPETYILTAINPKTSEVISNTITVLSKIIENKDVLMYYRNSSKYSVTLLTDNGEKTGSKETVEFNINGVLYKRQTNIYGQANLNINLPPGEYIITADYKDCKVSNTIKILSILEASDIKMAYKDGTKFKANVFNGNGNHAKNQNVTFNINGVFYTRTSNEYGIASLNINLPEGEYIITSTYNGLGISNKIIITNNIIKKNTNKTNFTYEIAIPNSQNVTIPYAYEYPYYTIKSGPNGIVRLDKKQLIEIQIGKNYYSYTTGFAEEYAPGLATYKYYLIGFDNETVQVSRNLEDLKGNGIIIYNEYETLHIYYRNNCSSDFEQFGVYMDKGSMNSESIHFIQNGTEKAKINLQILSYDEFGVRYSLSKKYRCTIYDFDYKSYDEIMKGNSKDIRFTNTNESVEFSYFGHSIVGYLTEENIITKFTAPHCIDFEKTETITYGLSEKYKGDFDVLQSFTIITDKLTQNQMNKWINRESEYKANVGTESIYAMFITSLNTCYLSDSLADNLSDEYNVKWSRSNNTVILGGMNWNYIYQHILTPDMGRSIKGSNESDIINFRFANSLLISKIEQYSLEPIANDGNRNISSTFDEIFKSLALKNASVTYYNTTAFINDENHSNSTLIIDLKTGLVTPLTVSDNFAFKGSTITRDCGLCSIYTMMTNIMKYVNTAVVATTNQLKRITTSSHSTSKLAIDAIQISRGVIGIILGGGIAVGIGIIGTMTSIQKLGVYYVDNYVEDNDIHSYYDHVTFTRPGYFQDVKIYNIPKEDGSVDYVQVKINDDNTLDRENTVYISNGNTRTLSKEETYQYFTEEKWEPFSVPKKYWR